MMETSINKNSQIVSKQGNGKKAVVIGAGFAGLSAASFLSRDGYAVTLVEKNDSPGGRARKFEVNGYTFDMGPSWYWMPDVFDRYFAQFGKKVSNYYELLRLDPGYTIWFGKEHQMNVPARMEAIEAMFERYEPGSTQNLRIFLREAAYKYEVGMNDFVHKPGASLTEFMDWRVIKSAFKLQMLTGMGDYVDRLFKNEHLRKLLKFPVLFLGATPEKTPAMYSLMNYADLALGTWYPQGGMFSIVGAMVSLAKELGVDIKLSHEVTGFQYSNDSISKVCTIYGDFDADIVVGGADYHHIDQHLLAMGKRNYNERYWGSRTMAPSSLLFYLGVSKKLEKLSHHNLFFDEDFKQHAQEIYESPAWPKKPLFYACMTSKTDQSAAPTGHENLFLLIPIAPGLGGDTEEVRESYYNMIMDRLEDFIGEPIRPFVDFKRSYAQTDFVQDYHAFKGNAYGLANTLSQTANFKPSIKSKRINNLYFTGQLTVPGPGVPPSLISGEVVSKYIGQVSQR